MKISIQNIVCICVSLFALPMFSGDTSSKIISKIVIPAARAAQKRAAIEAYQRAYGRVLYVYGYNPETGMQTMLPYDVISRLHTYQRKISSPPIDPDVPEGFYGGDCLSKETYYRALPLKHQEKGFTTQADLIRAACIIPYTSILYTQVYRAELDKNKSVDAAHTKAADQVTKHYMQGAEYYKSLYDYISWESFTSSH